MSPNISMQERIVQKLEQSLSPRELDVINESYLHAGHAGDDGSGESHWRVVIAADQFDSMSRVERERSVYKALAEEMTIIHALSVQIKP